MAAEIEIRRGLLGNLGSLCTLDPMCAFPGLRQPGAPQARDRPLMCGAARRACRPDGKAPRRPFGCRGANTFSTKYSGQGALRPTFKSGSYSSLGAAKVSFV